MRKLWWAMAPVLVVMPQMACAQPLFGADGYRVSHYRGVIADAPRGVRRVGARDVARLGAKALLIDVMPTEGGFRDAAGLWHLGAQRLTIPGAHWFPEAGRGDLAPGIAAWFDKGVARLARGDRRRTIVTFCLADCWMSWNAARRLRGLGYAHVLWLADGTDGWREAGLPLTQAMPERP